MKKYNNLIKLSNMLLEALWHLKKERLKSIQNSFEDFSYKCSQATRDSHLFYTAVNNNWLDAGMTPKNCTRIN